jgi:hypothetical protein
MKTYDKLRSKASSIDLIFPGHDPIMTSGYPSEKKISLDVFNGSLCAKWNLALKIT